MESMILDRKRAIRRWVHFLTLALLLALTGCATAPSPDTAETSGFSNPDTSASVTENAETTSDTEATEPATGTLRLVLSVLSEPGRVDSSQGNWVSTAFPISKYAVSLTGPDGEEVTTDVLSETYEDEHKAGRWIFAVNGLDELGTIVASASGSITVVGGTSIGKKVELEPENSANTLAIQITWPQNLFASPIVEIEMSRLVDGVLVDMEPLEVQIFDNARALFAAEMASGQYVVQANLMDDGILRASFLESVQVVANRVALLSEALTVADINMPPASAELVTTSAVSDESVLMSWVDSSDNEDGFRILRMNILSPEWGTVATVPPNTVSYLDSDLIASTQYTYKVEAFNRYGSTASQVAVQETLNWNVAPDFQVNPVDGAVLIDTYPLFAWKPIPMAISYELQLCPFEDFSSEIISSGPIVGTTYRASEMLRDRTTYYWRARGINEDGIPGEWTRPITFTVRLEVEVVILDAEKTAGTDGEMYRFLQGEPIIASARIAGESLNELTYAWMLGGQPLPGSDGDLRIEKHLAPGLYTLSCIVSSEESVVAGSVRFAISSELSVDGLMPGNDGTLWYDKKKMISWSPIRTASVYHIQVIDPEQGHNELITEAVDLSVPRFDFESDVEDEKSYAYRIRAADSDGAWSSWTPYIEFTMRTIAAPRIIFPSAGEVVVDPKPVIRWEKLRGIDGYELRISRLDGLEVFVHYVEESELPVANQLVKSKWRVSVRARTNAGETGEWSTRGFSVEDVPVPSLILPEDGESIPNRTPMFTWAEIVGISEYEVMITTRDSVDPKVDDSEQVDSSDVFAQEESFDEFSDYDYPVGEVSGEFSVEPVLVTGTDYVPDEELAFGSYAWKVRARASSGATGDYSQERAFAIDFTESPPSVQSPIDGYRTSSPRPVFTWKRKKEQNSFEIQIVKDGDEFDALSSLYASESSFTPSEKLQPGVYRWRVRAIDSSGIVVSDFSEKSDFEIVESAVMMFEIEGGDFDMGSPDGDKDEIPVRTVPVASFMMGVYEISQEIYLSVTGTNPSANTSNLQAPVENVSWIEAIQFCNDLSEVEGLTPCYIITETEVLCYPARGGYRLPTEAEWEFAARGAGAEVNTIYSGNDAAATVAWYEENSGGVAHSPGELAPNEIGLYDMTGNVWEWTGDTYGPYGQSEPGMGRKTGNEYKVVRGGSWDSSERSLRVTNRSIKAISERDARTGFRVALSSK